MSDQTPLGDYYKYDISYIDGDNASGELTFDDSTYTISTAIGSTTVTIPYQDDIDQLKNDVDAIKRRLAILDDPSPELLEKYKMLKDAYNKYKMIEALIGEGQD